MEQMSPDQGVEEKSKKLSFKLPDETVLDLTKVSHMAPEVMFKPSLVHSEYKGLHEMVIDSVKSVDRHLRASLYPRILLSGGNTMFPGFAERLKTEMQAIAPQQAEIDTTSL